MPNDFPCGTCPACYTAHDGTGRRYCARDAMARTVEVDGFPPEWCPMPWRRLEDSDTLQMLVHGLNWMIRGRDAE